MSKPYDLLKTPLMKRSRREWWGPSNLTRGARSQFALPMTDAASTLNAALAQRPRGYGPRKHRDRWFDMGAKLPAWVQTGSFRLTEAAKAVLFTLLHDMQKNGEARVAFGAIAAYAGVSEKTVERSIPILERLGLIEVVRGGWSNSLNRKVVNVYRIADVRLRSWWRRFFGLPTDKFVADPSPSKIPVSTARQLEWGEPTEAQTAAARSAAQALGKEGDPWDAAIRIADAYAFRGWTELAKRHGRNALLAVYQVALRVDRDPGAIASPRGYLRSVLSKSPEEYHPFPSIRKELNARCNS